MRRIPRPLLLLLCVYFLTALAWNITIPPYENLDELEHFEVIRYIALNDQLPVHGATGGFHARQEVSQPPLYHMLGAGWVRVWGLPTAPPKVRSYPATLVSCGQSETPYNKSKLVHNRAEGFPWHGDLLTLHWLRLLSTLLQIATLTGTWVGARRIFPHGPIPWLTTAMIAFNPQFLLVSAGVNNDNLITPLTTWGLIVAFDLWERGPTPWRVTLFGLLGGLAALSKLSGAGLLALGVAALFIRLVQRRSSLLEVLKWGAWMTAVVVVLLAPWLMRNLYLYGDPTALRPMLEIVGQRDGPIHVWGDVWLTLRSYWGQLPCVFYPRAVYWPYYGLVFGGLGGLFYYRRKLSARRWIALGLAALWLMIIIAAWVRWDLITPAPGGRLWFPASVSLALLVSVGWGLGSQSTTRLWTAALPLLSLLVLWIGPLAVYAPAASVPLNTPVPHPADIVFGDQVALRGYQARIKSPAPTCLLISEAACRSALEVTFYWQAIHPRSDPVLAVQLRSPVPQETTLRLNYNHWPAHGNLPLSAWPADALIRDHYVLPLPPADGPTQAWQLTVSYFDLASGTRLPLQVDGQAGGDSARLMLLRVPGETPPLPAEDAIAPVDFGGAITLRDAQVAVISDTWRVTLVWESIAPLADDYTVFVHALGDDPAPLATGDGPPMGGRFPTSLWQRGDLIYDEHRFTMPAGVSPRRIAVGLYRLADGRRLPARAQGLPLPDDAAIIWLSH